MTKQLKVREEIAPREDSVESFISQAISANVPMETLEKLFTLREKVKAEKAKEAYVAAMSDFQSQCPVIKKTKKVLNKDGTLRYQYAPLESIVEQIKTPVKSNGFSYILFHRSFLCSRTPLFCFG